MGYIEEFNLYDKVEYLYDQDLRIWIDEYEIEDEELEDGSEICSVQGDLIIDHAPAKDILPETVVVDMTYYDGAQYVYSCDIEILTNTETGERSIGWAKKGSAVSNAWRKHL